MKQRHKLAKQHRAARLAKRQAAHLEIQQQPEQSSTSSMLGMLQDGAAQLLHVATKATSKVISAANQVPSTLVATAVIASQPVLAVAQDMGAALASTATGSLTTTAASTSELTGNLTSSTTGGASSGNIGLAIGSVAATIVGVGFLLAGGLYLGERLNRHCDAETNDETKNILDKESSKGADARRVMENRL